MATVIGIFENQFISKKPLTVVKPGTQTRRFTHVHDTVMVCYEAWKKINACIIVYLIKQLTLLRRSQNCLGQNYLFTAKKRRKIFFILKNLTSGNSIVKRFGKINLKDYITSFIKSKKYIL